MAAGIFRSHVAEQSLALVASIKSSISGCAFGQASQANQPNSRVCARAGAHARVLAGLPGLPAHPASKRHIRPITVADEPCRHSDPAEISPPILHA